MSIIGMKAPARAHTEIFSADGSELIGEVTSGGFGPTLGKAIAMGYVRYITVLTVLYVAFCIVPNSSFLIYSAVFSSALYCPVLFYLFLFALLQIYSTPLSSILISSVLFCFAVECNSRHSVAFVNV